MCARAFIPSCPGAGGQRPLCRSGSRLLLAAWEPAAKGRRCCSASRLCEQNRKGALGSWQQEAATAARIWLAQMIVGLRCRSVSREPPGSRRPKVAAAVLLHACSLLPGSRRPKAAAAVFLHACSLLPGSQRPKAAVPFCFSPVRAEQKRCARALIPNLRRNPSDPRRSLATFRFSMFFSSTWTCVCLQ
jgi:hypothetical protein